MDGRFASPVYEPIKATVLSVWNNPRVHGSLQAFGGIAEASAGAALSATPLAPLGLAIMAHGADHVAAGGYTMMTGRPRATATEMLFQKAGMAPEQASLSNNLLSLGSFTAATGFMSGYGAVKGGMVGLSKWARMPIKASKTLSKGLYRSESIYQKNLLKTHLKQIEEYGAGGYRQLQNGRIRYYGIIETPRTKGEMAGRRLVREWNPDSGLKKTWHETVDHNGNVRIVRPETNDMNKIHYVFDINGNFTGIR